MLPIAILPVAGLLLGIGGSFTNETMLETYGLLGVMGPGTVLNQILQVMNAAGNIIFTNLPIIFAMGVAIGMAKKEKAVAALAAVIAFFIFLWWNPFCTDHIRYRICWCRNPDVLCMAGDPVRYLRTW